MAASHIDPCSSAFVFCHAMKIIIFLQFVPDANPLLFSYPGFQYGDVKLEGDAYIVGSDIQLTLNVMDQNKSNRVGRVTSFKMMHLWDRNSGQLAEFTTKFSFVIFSSQRLYGDGLTIFMADPNLPVPKHLVEGGGLGLVDGKHIMNSTEHPFVAVEFDTFVNSWDPNTTHVGMNINSVKSKKTVAWLTDISERKVYNCSIEYNATTHNLSATFTGYREHNPVKQHLSYTVDLRKYLPEWVIVGFSAATGDLFEVNALQSWSFSSSSVSNDENSESQIPPTAASPIPNSDSNLKTRSKKRLLVGLGIGVSVAMSLFGLLGILWRKRTRGKEEESDFDVNMDDEFQKGIGPKKFCYNELVSATNNFAEAEKLGQGGFGGVYKGYLKDINSYVAIKRISRESKQGIKEYATEVKIISKLRHRNLVQLIGWCHKKKDLLLIYEFMQNGSLDFHLYHGKNILTWQVRYQIALGLASALLYLQEEWEQCVLHRDIKSSNIMLDSNFNAKLGDFGLARLVDHDKGSQTTLIAGTMGYIAPEYITTGKASKESDVYSFGVVLLEIACGRKPFDLNAREDQINIVEWVWECYGMGKLVEVIDPKLCGAFDEQQVERLMVVGLCCAHPDYSLRPSVRQMIQVLNFEAPLPILPQKMPVPTYLPPTINAMFYQIGLSFEATYTQKMGRGFDTHP